MSDGSPMKTKPQKGPFLAKDTAKFKSCFTVAEGCWLWTGRLNKGGYGRFWSNYGNHSAHRISFEIERGPIPEGMVLDHICRTRSCVNPAHLRVVTGKENVLTNSVSVTAENAAKTVCKNGHPFTPENTRIQVREGSKRRACRVCDRARTDEKYKTIAERDQFLAERDVALSKLEMFENRRKLAHSLRAESPQVAAFVEAIGAEMDKIGASPLRSDRS